MSGTDLDLGLDLEPAENAKAPEAPKTYKGKIEYAPPYYTINIAFVEHLPEYEVVGVNGEVLQIQRGEDVPNIPEAFIKNLRTCISARQVKRKRDDGSEYDEWVPYPAIPFQVTDGPYTTRK